MLPTLALIGVSFALSYGPLTIAATDGVDEREQGVAGALLYTFFQFGTALGLAVVTAVVLAATPESGPTADTYRAGMVVPLVAALLGALIMAVPALRRRPGAGRGEGSGENGGEGVAPAPAAGREAAAAGGAR
jgi:hypothetical protein